MKTLSYEHESIVSRPICKFYARGYCLRGASCYFAHVLPDYPSVPTSVLPPDVGHVGMQAGHEEQQIQRGQCMYYMNGFCRNGKGCPRAHLTQPASKVKTVEYIAIECRHPIDCPTGYWSRRCSFWATTGRLLKAREELMISLEPPPSCL